MPGRDGSFPVERIRGGACRRVKPGRSHVKLEETSGSFFHPGILDPPRAGPAPVVEGVAEGGALGSFHDHDAARPVVRAAGAQRSAEASQAWEALRIEAASHQGPDPRRLPGRCSLREKHAGVGAAAWTYFGIGPRAPASRAAPGPRHHPAKPHPLRLPSPHPEALVAAARELDARPAPGHRSREIESAVPRPHRPAGRDAAALCPLRAGELAACRLLRAEGGGCFGRPWTWASTTPSRRASVSSFPDAPRA